MVFVADPGGIRVAAPERWWSASRSAGSASPIPTAVSTMMVAGSIGPAGSTSARFTVAVRPARFNFPQRGQNVTCPGPPGSTASSGLGCMVANRTSRESAKVAHNSTRGGSPRIVRGAAGSAGLRRSSGSRRRQPASSAFSKVVASHAARPAPT